jgi:hypothetical protein
MIAAAISSAVQRFGPSGCTERMAQEFGDHPDAAAQRMRWARRLAAQNAAPRQPARWPREAAAASRPGPLIGPVRLAAPPTLPRGAGPGRGCP